MAIIDPKKQEELRRRKEEIAWQQFQQMEQARQLASEEMENSDDIEQQPGESKSDFYRRQKINKLKSSISNKIQKQPQLAKTKKFVKQKTENLINKNPKIAQSYNNLKSFKDRRSEEIKKIQERAKEEIKTKVKQRTAQIAKRTAQATARIASQAVKIIARGLVQAAGSLLGAAIAAIGGTGCLVVIIVILAIIIIIAVMEQACGDNTVTAISAGLGPLAYLARLWACSGF